MDITQAMFMQFFSITLEKCVPHTKILDENFDFKPLTDEFIDQLIAD